MFSSSNPPIPLDVPSASTSASSSSSSSSSRTFPIIFVLLSGLTLILEIVSFTQPWWKDLTPFAADVGTGYANVSPNCKVDAMGYSQSIPVIAQQADCQSYNAIKAFLLLAHLAGIVCTILILICIFGPLCRFRLPLRGLSTCVAITMIFAFICNLIAMFVFIGMELKRQNECKKIYTWSNSYCTFPIHAGFILIIVVVVFQAVLCALLLHTVRSLRQFKQYDPNMPQPQPQPYAPQQAYQQSQYQPYQQPPQSSSSSMFSSSNPPMPLGVSSSPASSSSSTLRSPLLITFVAISGLTLILEIVSFAQPWWKDLTPFAAKVGTSYVTVSPSCAVSDNGYSLTILGDDADCSSYNAIKAFLLLAHLAGIACTILILLCMFGPLCRLRLPTRALSICVAITMIVAFICNLIAMSVFVGNEGKKQNECKKYYRCSYTFPWHAGFILILVVLLFQAVLCALLLKIVRTLQKMPQPQAQAQAQPQYAPQPQVQPYAQPAYQQPAYQQPPYQPYQQPPQYASQYQPPQPFEKAPVASAPAPPSADAGVFVPIPGSNAYVYYPPGQSPAGAQQHVQAIQTQMQTNAPTST